MTKIILIFGVIAGLIVTTSYTVSTFAHTRYGMGAGVAVGYLVMLIALALVFVGVKKYRDDHLGGVIRFSTALGVGAAISAVACFFYAASWELYLYMTDYSFMRDYLRSTIEAKRLAGASGADLAMFESDMAALAKDYEHPVYRTLLTLREIAPVAIIVTFISASLLKKSNFMPRSPAPSN